MLGEHVNDYSFIGGPFYSEFMNAVAFEYHPALPLHHGNQYYMSIQGDMCTPNGQIWVDCLIRKPGSSSICC